MITETKNLRTTPIDPKTITRVYSGKPGCGCGCRGKYSDTPRSVAAIVRAINKAIKAGEEVLDEHGCISYETDTRYRWAYTVADGYMK